MKNLAMESKLSFDGTQIAPSILSADFSRLAEEVKKVERGGAGLLHVDVMDGHFVPNITMGPLVVEALRRVTKLPLDTHLMIEDPDRYVGAFVKVGASMVSVHYEACPHLHRTLQHIRSLGAKAGVALNPATHVSLLEPVLGDLDYVLLMSVNPGFGGQAFIPETLDKARALKKMLLERTKRDRGSGRSVWMEMDGGIGESNISDVAASGVNLVVAGSAVFGAPDPAEAVRALLRRAAPRRKSKR